MHVKTLVDRLWLFQPRVLHITTCRHTRGASPECAISHQRLSMDGWQSADHGPHVTIPHAQGRRGLGVDVSKFVALLENRKKEKENFTGNTMSRRMTERCETSPLARVGRRTLLLHCTRSLLSAPPAHLRQVHKGPGKDKSLRSPLLVGFSPPGRR